MNFKTVITAISTALMCSLPLASQKVATKGNVQLLGAVGSDSFLPFWFYANTHTDLGSESNFSGLGEVTSTYALTENASLTGKASFFYRNNTETEAQRKELFLRFTNSWLKAAAGAFQQTNPEAELSASNKNFWMSGNARPMPGFLLEAPQPLKINNTFSLDWGIGHFFQNDDNRFVEDVWVHYKRLGVWLQLSEKHKLKAQLQHYAQWAGTSPVFGDLRDDFSAFVDVFFASEAVETGADDEFLNAVGNHMGSYLLDYYYNSPYGIINAYHEHPFEDGSGSRLANFPDGIWGLSLTANEEHWWSQFLYEYIDTSDQSGFTTDSGFDSYYRNAVYRSGWTYEGNVIGVPFILNDPSVTITLTNTSLISNRVRAHHFAAKGKIFNVYWLLKNSFTTHEGIFQEGYPEKIRTSYQYLNLAYPTETYGTFRLFGGFDQLNFSGDVFGVGLGYQYGF